MQAWPQLERTWGFLLLLTSKPVKSLFQGPLPKAGTLPMPTDVHQGRNALSPTRGTRGPGKSRQKGTGLLPSPGGPASPD